MSPSLLAAAALLALPMPDTEPVELLSSSVPAAPTSVLPATPPPFAAGSPSLPFAVPALPASPSPSPIGLAAGAAAILCLGLATLLVRRRKRQGPRHIRVVETTALGPKRSLALVVVGRQSLLLSCCDRGIFLVSSQPAGPELLEGPDEAPGSESPVLLFGRQPQAAPSPAPGGFAVQLAEAEETQGLRRRLSEAGVLR